MTWVLMLHFYTATGGIAASAMPMPSYETCVQVGEMYASRLKNFARFECINVENSNRG